MNAILKKAFFYESDVALKGIKGREPSVPGF